MAEGGLSIGVLSGRIDLDDNFTATIHVSNEALDALEKRFGGTHASALHAAEGFVAAEVALKAVEEVAHLTAEALHELTVGGAQVADVEENFNRLTVASGNLGEELLGNLKKGTHDTITDFELMKAVNDNLAVGVKLTSEQYTTLATGAFSIAQAKGIAVKQAFDDINFALETGKVKTVQYLTGKLDLAAAEDSYAAKIGTTSDRLSAEEKQGAARVAILDKVGQSVARLGEQQDGFDEKIAQVATSWKNFEEDLAKTVATSPTVLQAFDDIESILVKAFGTDKDAAIKAITADVESLARGAVEVVEVGVDIVKFMYDWRDVLEPTAVGLVAIGTALVAVSAGELAVESASKFWVLLTPEILAIGVAAGAIYAAFEVGKWQPVSDFFEHLSLEVFYGMSSAEADAAVATHHLTDEAVAAANAAKHLGEAEDEISLKTQNWKEVLDTVDGPIVDWAEHLLASGVSAKSVAAEYGLTSAQIRAMQSDLQEAAQFQDALNKRLAELEDHARMSRQELKAFTLTWESLNSIGTTYKDTIDSINPKIKESVLYYAQMGAKVDDLVKGFPGLGKAQAEAAVAGVKAAQDIAKVNNETFGIFAKMHGDSINSFIELETRKHNLVLKNLQDEGKATKEMLDAENDKYHATIDSEIQKREEQISTSRGSYQAQVDTAKATLDLMLAHQSDFVAEDIRLAREDLTEKQRTLETWAQDANAKLQAHAAKTQETAQVSSGATKTIAYGWELVGESINKDTEKVRTLSGELITLREYENRQHMGGSFNVSSQNLEQTLAGMGLNISAAENLAHQGYSLSEIVQILNSHGGSVPPPSGPRIPGFREGGYGDFGDGTLVTLHGKEHITTDEEWDRLNEKQAELWLAAGKQMTDEQLKIIDRMTEIAPEGKAGWFDNQPAAPSQDTYIFNVNGTAEDVADKIADIIMSRARRTRYFGNG